MKMALKTALSMKVAVFLLFCLLIATGALGQSSGGSAPLSSMYVVPDHTMHASSQPMAQVQSLFPSSSSIEIAQGELPLWEVAPEHHEIPLGDAARLEKKEHATVKKASVVWEN
ncbi:MAG TPA: hypothetical protein VEK33_01345 [Terriglobales bacterium]|nr:hypothetical protein [Terriglobales bacterium]